MEKQVEAKKSLYPLPLEEFYDLLQKMRKLIPSFEHPDATSWHVSDPDDEDKKERALQELELSVQPTVSEAIGEFFLKEKWPRSKSLVRWAAVQRFDYVEKKLIEWSKAPRPLVMAVHLNCPPNARTGVVWLLTNFYEETVFD